LIFLTGLLLAIYWWGRLSERPVVVDAEITSEADPFVKNEDLRVFGTGDRIEMTVPDSGASEADGLRKLARQLVEEDPLMGVVYFEDCLRQGAFDEARRFLRAFSFQWAGVDPGALAAWISELPTAYQNEALTGLISGGVKDHSRRIGDWILSLGDGPLKTRAVQLYGQFMTDSNESPHLADWAWDLVSGSEDPATYLGILTPLIAATDPLWMYAFIEELPDSETRNQCIHGLVTVLARERPLETLDWSQSFADSGLRNDLEGICLQVLGKTAPRDAARWILDKRESPLLEARVTRLFEVWTESDPGAARTFLQNAPIDPEMKAYLLRIRP
jgi:hypothetical protein